MKDKLKNFLNYEEVPGKRPTTIGDLRKATDDLLKSLTGEDLADMMETAASIEDFESAQKFKDELDRRKDE